MSVFDPKICQAGHTDKNQCYVAGQCHSSHNGNCGTAHFKCECGGDKSIEAERDRLHKCLKISNDHLQKMQVTNGSLTDEISRLKAEVRFEHVMMEQIAEDRDGWKAKAEKMAEALKRQIDHEYYPQEATRNAKAALEEFEK